MVKPRLRDELTKNLMVPSPRPTSRGLTTLSRLLYSHTFSVHSKLPSVFQRICYNLQTFGGQLEDGGGAYIGEEPIIDFPSIGIAERPGTLGAFSFGFLNNVQGVAAFAAPMAERPKQGTVAVVVPRRDALPEIVPLLCKHRLGISWVISVGDGDPAEVVRFLSSDPATTGILMALGRGTRPQTLHQTLGIKPAALLETDSFAGHEKEASLCRAIARRSGCAVVTDLEEWLAHGSLFDAKVNSRANSLGKKQRKNISIFVIGAGKEMVAKEAKRAQLSNPIPLEADDQETVDTMIAQAAAGSEYLILCGDTDQTLPIQAASPILRCDPAQPERLRALFQAAAFQPLGEVEMKALQTKPDLSLLATVTGSLPPPIHIGKRQASEEILSDHDTKRFLHAYGVRVSRQAPANTVTAASRIASKIGFPLVLLPADLSKEMICLNPTDLKHQTTLMLARFSHVMIREYFSSSRLPVKVTKEKGMELVMWVHEEAAILPILKGEAKDIAAKMALRYPISAKKFAECLGQISTCVIDQGLLLHLEIYPGEDPAVVKAEGILGKRQTV